MQYESPVRAHTLFKIARIRAHTLFKIAYNMAPCSLDSLVAAAAAEHVLVGWGSHEPVQAIMIYSDRMW